MPDNVDLELTCRDHGWKELFAEGGTFPLPGDRPRYPRDRIVDIRHVRLDINLDLDAARIAGTVAHTFAPPTPAQLPEKAVAAGT